MACCGLCRPKVKPTIKTNKNLTINKVNTIDMWIDNIEGHYEPIELPSKPPDKPKVLTNTEEIAEIRRNDLSGHSTSTERDDTNQYDNTRFNQNKKSRKQNFQYLSSDSLVNEELQSTISENSSVNNS